MYLSQKYNCTMAKLMFSNIFKRLFNFGALFYLCNVDMVTSKYSQFGYDSMCENINKNVCCN